MTLKSGLQLSWRWHRDGTSTENEWEENHGDKINLESLPGKVGTLAAALVYLVERGIFLSLFPPMSPQRRTNNVNKRVKSSVVINSAKKEVVDRQGPPVLSVPTPKTKPGTQ